MARTLLVFTIVAASFFACCSLTFSQSNSTEYLTITTYYPSPHGYYGQMTVARRMAIGDVNSDTQVDINDLAIDGSGNPQNGILTVAKGIGIGSNNLGPETLVVQKPDFARMLIHTVNAHGMVTIDGGWAPALPHQGIEMRGDSDFHATPFIDMTADPDPYAPALPGDRRDYDVRITYDPDGFYTGGPPDVLYILAKNLQINERDTGQGLMLVKATGTTINSDLTVTGLIYGSVASDKRLKKNIKTIENPLASVERLRGVSFEWIDPQQHANRIGPQIGLIAQEVEQVLPQMVTVNSKGYKGIDVRGFDALLIESVKELKAENDALKKRIEKLEAAQKNAAQGR